MVVVLVWATKYIPFLLFTEFDKIFPYGNYSNYIDGHTYFSSDEKISSLSSFSYPFFQCISNVSLIIINKCSINMPISIFKSSCYGNINLFRCHLYTKMIWIVFEDNFRVILRECKRKNLLTIKVPNPTTGIWLPFDSCIVRAPTFLWQIPNIVQR